MLKKVCMLYVDRGRILFIFKVKGQISRSLVLYIKFWHFNPCGHDYGNLIISSGQDYGNLDSFMLNEMGIFNTKLLYDVFACES